MGDLPFITRRSQAQHANRRATRISVGRAIDGSPRGRGSCGGYRAAAQGHRVGSACSCAVAQGNAIGSSGSGSRADSNTVSASGGTVGQGRICMEILDACTVVDDVAHRGAHRVYRRVGGEQLAAVDHIGTRTCQLACCHVGDLPLTAYTTDAQHITCRWSATGKGITNTVDSGTGRGIGACNG